VIIRLENRCLGMNRVGRKLLKNDVCERIELQVYFYKLLIK